jgi:amino acid transporter
MLKVFSSGCTAMTGVEAVSNGVMAFRDDTRRNAKITLTIIIVLLAILLIGIALLCRAYGVGATDPGSAHYESVLSMLTRAVMGQGWFYYVTIGSVLLVLALSANTAFADFPRLTRAIAQDNYLPHVFLLRGRRLLYSWGIYVLVGLTALLLTIFGGVTDRLIPLYAIGAFMAFTLSQAGMVMHWKRKGDAHVRMAVNGLGAFATGITTLVVLVAKFVDGAWITALDCLDDPGDAKRETPLHTRGARNRPASPHCAGGDQRTDRGGTNRSLEPHHREGHFVRAFDVERHSLPARADH